MAINPRTKITELLGLFSFAAAILLLLSLLSYDVDDPCLNVAAPDTLYSNFIGEAGAWTADLSLQMVGLAAFLLPLPLLLLSYRSLGTGAVDRPFVKLFGFWLMMASLTSILNLIQAAPPFAVNFMPGGLVGFQISQELTSYFNTTGSLIILATLFLTSLIIATRFSFEALIGWTSSRNWNPSATFKERYQNWKESRNQRKQLAELNQNQEAVVAQRMPRQISLEGPETPAQSEPSPAPPSVETKPVLATPTRPREESPARWEDQKTVQPERTRQFQLPSLDFLQHPIEESSIDEQDLIERAHKLASKCSEFDVTGRVLQIHPGPVVTTFEFKPDPGVKYSRITNLADDLCLALKAESIRIDRIPGKNTVGIEVPNPQRNIIYLKEVLASTAFQQSSSQLTLGLGQLINGSTYVTDLSRMPHLLIAGSTGSGKSVGLNCMVCSILYKASPSQVRFIMVDPKRLELGLYDGIPHLLTPIVTDPRQAANALNWAVREMEERYRILAKEGVRNIDQYNRLCRKSRKKTDEEQPEPLPYVVIIVDELADLMITAGKEVETSLIRLAQMARAVGIHLILATQRPSVDVLTGLIKANFPSRVSFRVSSRVDSRTILDSNGAERLLGLGDSLFLSPGTSRLIRIHGAFISEEEIANITGYLIDQAEPDYHPEVLESPEEPDSGPLDIGEMEDELFSDAARFVVENGKASTSLLQRRFRIGYGRAARLLDMMEHEGIVGPSEGTKPREVLVPDNYFDVGDDSR